MYDREQKILRLFSLTCPVGVQETLSQKQNLYQYVAPDVMHRSGPWHRDHAMPCHGHTIPRASFLREELCSAGDTGHDQWLGSACIVQRVEVAECK